MSAQFRRQGLLSFGLGAWDASHLSPLRILPYIVMLHCQYELEESLMLQAQSFAERLQFLDTSHLNSP